MGRYISAPTERLPGCFETSSRDFNFGGEVLTGVVDPGCGGAQRFAKVSMVAKSCG